MCGIAGYFITKPHAVRAEPLQELARNLLRGIESRGRDATGYAYVSKRDGWLRMAKAPVDAGDFLDIPGHLLSKGREVQSMPQSMILHTRHATQGSPEDNRNNHPIYCKQSGLCMVHNGWLIDDDGMIRDHELVKDAEVDTETYLRLIEKYYLLDKADRAKEEKPTPKSITESVEFGITEATREAWGSLACAMIQGGKPETMWLWRDTGAMYFVQVDWGFVFASTDDAVQSALYNSFSALDMSYFEPLEVEDNQLIRLELNGITEVLPLETPEWGEDYNVRVWDNDKQKFVKRRPKGMRYLGDNYDPFATSIHHTTSGPNGTAHYAGMGGNGAGTPNEGTQSGTDKGKCLITGLETEVCGCTACTKAQNDAKAEKAKDEAFRDSWHEGYGYWG